jgi:DNA-binding SARP family transcriptional activator
VGREKAFLNKLSQPALSNVVPRERLFRSLDDALSRPVVWVTAPGGSGKTTLVADYLESRKLRCAWYQIDQGDSDIATFFYFMGQAAKKAAPRLVKPLPLFTKEYLSAVPSFSRRFFESFFAKIPNATTVVFDNFQDAHGQLFHDVIYEGLEAVPDGVSVIIISREDPPERFARLQANARMSMLGWEQVRFTEDETSTFVLQKLPDGLPDETLRRLHHKTEGWVAGLLLIVEHARMSGVKLNLDDAWSPEVVFNYFAAEVLSRMDKDRRTFLLATSFLPYMPVSLATRLTGNDQAGRILGEMTRNHYFTTRRFIREQVYQYHQLFREFLLARAMEAFDMQKATEIRSRAASLLEEAGDPAEAFLLHVQARDWQKAIGLVLAQASGLLAQGRDETIRGWISSLPVSMVEESAELLYCHGASLVSLNPHEAMNRLKKAFSLFRGGGNRAGMFMAWSAAADVAFYLGQYAIQREWYAVLCDLLDEDHSFPDRGTEIRVTLSAFNVMAFTMTDHPDISRWHEKAYAVVLNDVSCDINQRLMTGVHLWVYYGWTGDFARMAVLTDFLVTMTNCEGVSELVRLVIMTDRVLYGFLTARCEESLRIAEETMSFVEQTGIRAFSVHVMGQAVSCALSIGDVPTADRLLERMKGQIDNQISIDAALYHSGLAWKAALADDFTTALEHTRIATSMCSKAGFLAIEGIGFSAIAEFLWEVRDVKEARRMLALGYERARSIRSIILEFFCLLVDAQIAFGMCEEETGLGFLSRAFGLARANGYVNKYMWRPKVMSELCARALDAGIETEFVCKLIRLRKLTGYPPSTPLESWPWPVKVYTLGRFELHINGESVRFTGKVQKKPLEMLKALFALGGLEARVGQLSSMLWPDADGDSARQSIKITLHRLREMLDSDRAVRVIDGRLSLDRSLVWADVWAFDSLLRSAQVKGESGEELAAIRLTGQAIALYRGQFLEEEGSKSWVVSRRKHLKSKYILHVIALGSLWQAKGEPKRAIALYLEGLEVDDLAEELYQKLMECYLAAGLRGEAASTFQRCKKNLAYQGLMPSAGSVALYKKALA